MMLPQSQDSSLENHLPKDKRIAVGHASEVLTKFVDFYEKEKFCDVVLIAGIDKTKINAHQMVLSSSSEYFRALFFNTLNGSTTDEVNLKEIDGDTLRSVTAFFYTGSIELCRKTIEGITKTAHFYQIDSLLTVCSDFIAEQIDFTNCFGIAIFAEQYNLTMVAEKSMMFACKNFKKSSKEKEFLELTEEHLSSFISRDDLNVDSEERVFNSLAAWINYDKENRIDSTLNLLKHIRFTLLTPEFITENIPLVCSTDESHNLVRSWLQWHNAPAKRPDLGLENKPSRKISQTLIFVNFKSNHNITVHTFDPDLRTWSSTVLPPAPKERYDSAYCGIYDDKLIIYDRRKACFIEYFDFTTKKWSDIPHMYMVRENCQFFDVDGQFCVYGSSARDRYGQYFNRMEKFEFESNAWKKFTNLPTKYIDWLTYANGRFYALGVYSDMHCYDPVTDVWTKTTFPENKQLLAEVDGRLYAFGGGCNSVYRYNETKDKWKVSGSFTIAMCLACTALRNKLITLSRKGSTYIISEYNTDTNKTTTLPTPEDATNFPGYLLIK